ncbi:hypothetical protein [Streptomyces afghaniensis]|uniref:hypothetical protein n=1 Tax=Streptomyces afghaniensis TaxID=66865 RepID=UPI0027862378|nr:hypothetical protein [Streptomyces afghaniensis]MDQ1018643.1 hypothetical protein [Streptomyces afghaniensis]
MLISRISLRLLPSEELVGDPFPDACVQLAFDPTRPSDEVGAVAVPEAVRITPADLVRLRVESGLALGEIRAEMQRAEIAWRQQRSRWYRDGRLAAEARAPDISLLQRVLDGLRNPGPVTT